VGPDGGVVLAAEGIEGGNLQDEKAFGREDPESFRESPRLVDVAVTEDVDRSDEVEGLVRERKWLDGAESEAYSRTFVRERDSVRGIVEADAARPAGYFEGREKASRSAAGVEPAAEACGPGHPREVPPAAPPPTPRPPTS